ncbi:MAG: cysteine--tRNA ligase [Rickettsiales bacterium]|nr:MAG: cysteine--tRNA ligase [Rickettsiales bacterium]
MKLSLFNTLTRNKEVFNPISKSLVKMYVCGPTVYDHPHIGNARSVVIYDMLYRLLTYIYGKDKVLYVRNITDIDDKIIERALKDSISIEELTSKTTEYFHHDMKYLACLSPNIEPKATEHIEDMINIINILLEKNIAYVADGHIYFDVTKYPDYTKISGQLNEELLESVRIDSSTGKKNAKDFVLWKPAQDNDIASSIYESPFGLGRPGWHIECSAMSHKFLGETFDIHGGGIDLIFPHHTNEIAQSCSAFANSEYAKMWVHNGFLTVNHEKMSKSLGNFLTVKDLIKKGLKGDVIRLFLLSAHYRKPLDYNDKAIKDCSQIINYWFRAIERYEEDLDHNIDLPSDFMESLLDDMNSSQSITIINNYAKAIYSSEDEDDRIHNASILLRCARFLGLMQNSCSQWFHSDVDVKKIEQLIAARDKARKTKNWLKADKYRKELEAIGIVIEDNARGVTTWKKKI